VTLVTLVTDAGECHVCHVCHSGKLIMYITHEIWLRCKTDYLTGKGSLCELAALHGIARSSVEKKARKEEWTRLRTEFEAAQIAKLMPPALPSPPLDCADCTGRNCLR
jgi:hypothetical protein